MSRPTIEDFYAFKVGAMWRYFKAEHFSFWMICAYLLFEYVRPQSIYAGLDFLPWAQLFLVLSLMGALADPTCKLAGTKVSKWLVFYLILVLLSAYVFALYPGWSRPKLADIYTWVIIHFLVLSIVNTKERFYIFLMIFCLASFKLSLFGARTWTLRGFAFTDWGIRGPPGYFTNSGELAIQMLVFFPVGYYLLKGFSSSLPRWERVLLILFPVTAAMTVLGASSRGAQLALLVQLMLMFSRNIFKFKYLLLAAVVSFLAITFLPEEQKARFDSMGEDRTSVQRLLYWEHGVDMILERPWTGTGFFNFVPYYNTYFPEDLLYQSAELPHNIFIQAGTDIGMPGLFVYCAILLYSVTAPWRLKKYAGRDPTLQEISIARGLSLGMVGFILAGQFVSVVYYPYLWVGVTFIACWERAVANSVET